MMLIKVLISVLAAFLSLFAMAYVYDNFKWSEKTHKRIEFLLAPIVVIVGLLTFTGLTYIDF